MLPQFDYLAPDTMQETLKLLAQHRGEAKVLAGGTDILVNMRARQEHAKYLIDIKGVKELQQIYFDEKNGLAVGAAVSLNKLIHHRSVSERYPVLATAAGTIGDYEIRNRATLVGNICNASPAADSAPALLVLNAAVNISSETGNRTLPIGQFFAGVKKTKLSDNELVTSINVPVPPGKSKAGYLKARRTAGEDVALIGVGGLVAPNGGKGKQVRLAYASLAPTPVRAYEAERIFEQNESVDWLLNKAMPSVMAAVSPISDVRSGSEYRAHLVRVLTMRLVKQLWELT